MKRTQKDETQFDQHLRDQETIKTEVIVHLKTLSKELIADNIILMETLIRTTDMLMASLVGIQSYRRDFLNYAKKAKEQNEYSSCAFDCKQHEFHTVKGWTKK